MSAGTVWFYQDGAANTLSHFRIEAYRKRLISYNTYKFHSTGTIQDFHYEVVTKEGRIFNFTPALEVLHALKMNRMKIDEFLESR